MVTLSRTTSKSMQAESCRIQMLLCYARHHGFPTTLLDWSHTFFVAAFFSYSTSNRDTDVAIWAFKE
ncbi:FRG domain-containing protein [Agrobacterium bohemicum]|uniref:FRG domain-containing protein n=1 Tax=Agrobacterium bohemicum TaxID=2052828 RepID=UPI0009EC03F1